MNARTLKEKLVKGETVYGTFFQHAINPAMVDFLPEGALDFVIVTPEHTALDLAEFLPIRYALASKGIACLARTHSREPDDVSKVCDTFDGVVVPYVEDVEHAKRLAAAAVFRPLKGRALDRVLAEGKWPSEKTRRYITEERCRQHRLHPHDRIGRGRGEPRRDLRHPRGPCPVRRPQRPDGQHGNPQRVRSPRPHRDAQAGDRHGRSAPRRRRLLVRQSRAGLADDPSGRTVRRLLERRPDAEERHGRGVRPVAS